MTTGAARSASTGEGATEAAGPAPMVAEATEQETVVAEVEVEATTVVEPAVAVTAGSLCVSMVADEALFTPPPKGDTPEPRETPNDSLVDAAALLDRAIVWMSLSGSGAEAHAPTNETTPRPRTRTLPKEVVVAAGEEGSPHSPGSTLLAGGAMVLHEGDVDRREERPADIAQGTTPPSELEGLLLSARDAVNELVRVS